MRLRCFAAALALLPLISVGQQIPDGVRYKKASDAENAKAVSELKSIFARRDPSLASDMTSKALVLGPGLWADLQPHAPAALINAMKGTYHIPTDSGVLTFDGRVCKTRPQDIAFWKEFFETYPGGKDPVIRKLTTAEIKYHWSWIAWDIEEPIYIVEMGHKRILINFMADGKIFIVDRMGEASP